MQAAIAPSCILAHHQHQLPAGCRLDMSAKTALCFDTL